jgi:hypothetical protein
MDKKIQDIMDYVKNQCSKLITTTIGRHNYSNDTKNLTLALRNCAIHLNDTQNTSLNVEAIKFEQNPDDNSEMIPSNLYYSAFNAGNYCSV